MNNNVTGKNTEITSISDTIQQSRIILKEYNKNILFSSEDTRRVVLLCLLYLCAFEYNDNETLVLYDILSSLNITKGYCVKVADPHQINLNETIAELTKIQSNANWRELLNYAFEAFEYDVDDYFSVNISRGVRSGNKEKKNRGVYYTPIDVVRFMASTCVSNILEYNQTPSIIDCSCGSGVFLLECFTQIDSFCNPEGCLDNSIILLQKCIWGIDVSSAAIDCCKAVFTRYFIDKYQEAISFMPQINRAIEKSFFVGDSTHFYMVLAEHNEIPKFFDCIIGNPPYVSIGKTTNLFAPFVENLLLYSSETSCCALVLPLSICYSKSDGITKLREAIQNDTATWEFLNYDRSPDSLFGDQVKTRNTILFRKANKKGAKIFTTKLQRWTSTNRNRLFENVDLCDISNLKITNGIPKISSEIERQAFQTISQGKPSLFGATTHKSNNDPFVIINGTAYNWICVYDHIPPSTDENGNIYLSATAKTYYLPNKDEQYFCIALLSNRIAYWYWSVIGDGFHFNASFFDDYCIGRESFSKAQFSELAKLGEEYSKLVQKCPTASYNAGKRIINYSHWGAFGLIEKIEKTIIDALDLPNGFYEQISSWYFDQVQCCRNKGERKNG